MTEVPDHLLQRSRERRAALGGSSAPAAAPSGGGDDGGAAASTAAAVPAAAAAAPAVVEYVPPPPPPPYVQAALDRKKLPRWMAGVGALTLLWAFIYAGVLFSPEATITDPIVAEGEEIYASRCASCHGAGGEGGSGRPLADSVILTFPDIADHIAFVANGSPPAGTPYGSPDRPGGQHIARSQGFGQMPAWAGVLTEDEILAVVRYEREVLDNEEPSGAAAGESGSGSESGSDSPTNEAESSGGDVTEGDESADDTDTQSSETDGGNDAEGSENEGDAGTEGTETTP